jgi:predicted transcriptional regulator of viral defense system
VRSEYTKKEEIGGIKGASRTQLGLLLRKAKGTVSLKLAAEVWAIPESKASKILARFAANGWLARVRRGLYVPVALDAVTSATVVEDPWLVAQELFSPCYIGGWSAAEYWELTEQLFNTLQVMTTRRPRQRNLKMQGIAFKVKTIPAKALFGLKEVWRGQVKVSVSSPARTVVDMLDDPATGGGIRAVRDIFLAFRKSNDYKEAELLETCRQFGSGTVYKRLGYLAEFAFSQDKNLIEECRRSMTKGYSKLDPALKCDKIATAWRLWVPGSWKEGRTDDR